MIDQLPPPSPPAVERPVSFSASYGIVSGTVSRGTRRVVVRVGGRTIGRIDTPGRAFALQVDLPPREVAVDVVAIGTKRLTARTRIRNVLGLPVAASPVDRRPVLDERLAAVLRRLIRAYPSTVGFYVVDLTGGRGAAWNAAAQFPGASSLKLAVAVMALAAADSVPAPGSRLDGLLRRMLVVSDNMAANEVEAWAGGSTSGGSHRVNALMTSLGLTHTEMYGGYLRETSSVTGRRPRVRPIPVRVDRQPWWGVGKRTTAFDLGTLLRYVWLASGGLGPLPRAQPEFTAGDARYLLYLLGRVRDHGKIDRFLGAGDVVVLHKAGWIDAARHDNGLVVWPGGVLLVTVMTYRGSGTGVLEDALTGRVARSALQAVRG